MANQGNDFPLLAKVINGGIAGMVGTTCVFPIDLVKTRLQNQVVGPNGELHYKNMLDAFRKIHSAEGFRGMYRGSLVTIFLVTPEKAVKLTANDMFRHLLTPTDGTKLSVLRQMLAGALAGTLQIIITTPAELLKIQLQNAGQAAVEAKKAGKEIQHVTARTVALNLIKERGIFGFYRGLGPTAARDISFSIVYFPLFATLNEMGPRRADGSGESVHWWPLVGGLLAGSISAVAVTPMDVIKTRMQLMNKDSGQQACVGLLQCLGSIYKTEGLKAFFKGGLCRMMVLAPLFGIAQAFYLFGVGEQIVAYFRGKKVG